MDNSTSESRGRVFYRGDRVRLTAKGERMVRRNKHGIATHMNGVEYSQTGTVVHNSGGEVVRVRWDSAPERGGMYYRCDCWELIDEAPRKPAKLGPGEVDPVTSDTIAASRLRMLCEENMRLRKAGAELAVAAIRVATEYDGCHRLMLAVSGWTKAIADEHGRGQQNTDNHEEKNDDRI